MAVDGRTLLVTLAIDFGIGLGALLLFSILRIVGPTKAYYDPRWYVLCSGLLASACATNRQILCAAYGESCAIRAEFKLDSLQVLPETP